MKCDNKKAEDVQIAYIGGGSRGWAWTFMTDLALEPDMIGTIRLYDIDREAAEANEVIGNAVSAREDAKGKWEYRTCATLGEALTGADFAVISILPGTFDEMEADVHLPERLGIWQSVGDTAGPGGMMRALRTIPMFVEIAEAVKEYAPEAWVINYTNPMSLCVKTLYHGNEISSSAPACSWVSWAFLCGTLSSVWTRAPIRASCTGSCSASSCSS